MVIEVQICGQQVVREKLKEGKWPISVGWHNRFENEIGIRRGPFLKVLQK
jgi:hypothetical protein